MNDNFEKLLDGLEEKDDPNVSIFGNENVNVTELPVSNHQEAVYAIADDAEIATLSEKEKLFCLNYVHNGMNIYQAAVSAGYAPSYAKSASYKLLENVGIKKYISHLFSEIEKNMMGDIVMSKMELMKFWTDIARGQLHNPHAIPKKAVEEMEQLSFFSQDKDGGDVFSVPDECKIPLSQRLKASEYIAKHYEMFADVLQKNETNINIGDVDLKNLSDEQLAAMINRLTGGDGNG